MIQVSNIRKSIGSALAAILVAVFVVVPSHSAQAAGNTPADQMLAMTNYARAADGIAPLASDSVLNSIARDWSVRMSQAQSLTHNPNLGETIDSRKGYWRSNGENIARVCNDKDPYGTAFVNWVNSAGHLANILRKEYDAQGFGYSIDADGCYWMTVVFYRGDVPADSTPVPVQVPKNLPDTKSRYFSQDLIKSPQDEDLFTLFSVENLPKTLPVTRQGGETGRTVILSHDSKVQRYNSGSWSTVDTLKKGTRTLTVKAVAKPGSFTRYRILMQIGSATQEFPFSVKSGPAKKSVKKVHAKVKGMKTGVVNAHKGRVYKDVIKVTHKSVLQKQVKGKWKKVKTLKPGRHVLKIKVTAKTQKFRVVTPKTSKVHGYTSKRLVIKAKASKVKGTYVVNNVTATQPVDSINIHFVLAQVLVGLMVAGISVNSIVARRNKN